MTDRHSVDVVVVGAGAAGVSAARAAHEAGASVLVIDRGGGGSSGLTSGAIVTSGTDLELAAFAWLPSVGLRAVGAYALGTSAGGLTSALSGLTSLLDLSELPEGALGVVDMLAGPGWSARLVAGSLARAAERTVRTVEASVGAVEAPSALELAARLDTDGLVDALAESLRVSAQGCGALLFPPVLGLQKDDVAARLGARLGRIVGETTGGIYDATAVRMARALSRGVPSGVEQRRGSASIDARDTTPHVRVGDTVITARAVVLATGHLASAGLEYRGTLSEPCTQSPVWLLLDRSGTADRYEPASGRQLDPSTLMATAMASGLRCLPDRRVANASGTAAVAPWLFAAGALLAGGRLAYGQGLADALVSGYRAGRAAADLAAKTR